MTDCRYRLVMFDWQGTLADPAKYFVRYCLKTIKSLTGKSLPVSSLSDLSSMTHFHFATIEGWVRRTLPQLSPVLQQAVNNKLWHYCRSEAGQLGLHSGVGKLFCALHQADVIIAVISSASSSYLHRALALGQLDQYVSYLRTPDDGPSKPSPLPLQAVLAMTSFEHQQAVMVGDTVADFQAANAAGIDFIGCCVKDQRLQTAIAKTHPLFSSIGKLQAYLFESQIAIAAKQKRLPCG